MSVRSRFWAGFSVCGGSEFEVVKSGNGYGVSLGTVKTTFVC